MTRVMYAARRVVTHLLCEAPRRGTLALVGLISLSTAEAASQTSGPTVLVGPECAACEIVADPLVRLGDTEGLGMLESGYNLVYTDRRGRFFVTARRPYFWVFDSSGRVTHRIGRSGEGPGEFSNITGIAVGQADSIFVLDGILQRVSVYTPDLALARTFRLGFSENGPELFVGPSLVVNSGIHTEERVGLPLHVLDRDGRMTRSFGSLIGGVYRADMQEIIDQRKLGPSDADSFWAARTNQYLIEQWSTDGRLLQTLRREAPWFEVWWEIRSGVDVAPLTTMSAIEQVGDTLWVLATVPGEQWR